MFHACIIGATFLNFNKKFRSFCSPSAAVTGQPPAPPPPPWPTTPSFFAGGHLGHLGHIVMRPAAGRLRNCAPWSACGHGSVRPSAIGWQCDPCRRECVVERVLGYGSSGSYCHPGVSRSTPVGALAVGADAAETVYPYSIFYFLHLKVNHQ